jgi:hypothetical protein
MFTNRSFYLLVIAFLVADVPFEMLLSTSVQSIYPSIMNCKVSS